MNILEEARLRLACCKADTGDGWGEALSLHNFTMTIDRRLEELHAFAEEIRSLPEDAMRLDDDIVALMGEYRGLMAVKKEVCQYLGIVRRVDQPEEKRLDREAFKGFLERLLA